jgi:hypothetical protein
LFKITFACEGVPKHLGAQAAIDIAEDFKQRPWHQNVTCTWDGSRLLLTAENDYDENGLALQDEFSDEISACVSDGFDGSLRLISVSTF